MGFVGLAWSSLIVGPCCLGPGPGPSERPLALVFVSRPAPASWFQRGRHGGRWVGDLVLSPWRGLHYGTGGRLSVFTVKTRPFTAERG